MKTDTQDIYDPDGPQVEPCLLLRYLIEKSEELAHINHAGFPLTFRGLGLSVLDPFSDLKKEFLTIISPSDDSVNERAEKCKDIFIEALGRPQPLDSNFYVSKGGEDHRFERIISNRFCWAARRLGEEMVEQRDFRYLPIWTCMTWIGLHGDAEKFSAFQEKCLLYTDPAERIEAVIPLLWEVMTRKPRKN
jgi:hypothetical protein